MTSATTSPAPPGAPTTRTAAVGGPRWTPSALWATRILLANLVGQVVIVVTGGIVRLTGSGLGCSTWPECEPGQFTPVLHDAVSWHPIIEFGNRTLAGVLVALGLATAWVVWRRRDRALRHRLLGLVPLVGVLVQAVVGGVSVRVDLHPAVVGSHFLISMVLVAASAALVTRHREGDGVPVPLVGPRVRALAWAVAAICVVVLALGVVVTGSGPHSGDEDEAFRFALDPARVARLHSASVWLYVVGVLSLLVLTRTASRRSDVAGGPRRATLVLLVVTLLQGLVGYVQYFTGLPAVLVGVHMLGASLLVIAQVRQLLSLRSRVAPGVERPRLPADR